MLTRDCRIVMDYVEGDEVQVIALRESLSHQRVYQILVKTASRLFGSWYIHTLRYRKGAVLARLRAQVSPVTFDKTTPEGHYWEVHNEPRVFAQWGYKGEK